ncbi:hypothetical protein [Rubrivirga sp.]|uniref:hypothetical protein n=1 Tax=Rubrivirga sp. TaxID=1885344 RepID=UPI003C77B26A
MPTARLADRQIRAAAAQAALRLDVRGPVSKALGDAGITIEPADLERVVLEDESNPRDRAPEPRVRPRGRGLEPTHKPFKDTPWPSRSSTSRATPASGLTPDERRVHRILLEQLELASQYGHGTGTIGLTYAEKKHLKSLNLAFIEDEIAKMDRGLDASHPAVGWGIGFGTAMMVATAGLFALMGETAFVAGFLLVALAVFTLGRPFVRMMEGVSQSTTPRRKIYHALRELALLVHDLPESPALDHADRVIDQFSVLEDEPLDLETGASRTNRRTRTHS